MIEGAMKDKLRPFRIYRKKGEDEMMNFHHFTVDKSESGAFSIALYDSNEKVDGALGFGNIAAIIPETQRHGFYGYNIRLKNGKSFDVAASAFRMEPDRVVFLHGRSEPIVMDEVYVASSQVFSILPTKGLDWDS
jgi:hypothetical protein